METKHNWELGYKSKLQVVKNNVMRTELPKRIEELKAHIDECVENKEAININVFEEYNEHVQTLINSIPF